ncbi:MAG: hypothetical protein HY558_03405 [Euryarchaeota archaeon]|nr:hypothetical protein [Euryarchaeota archaeon]
MGYESSYAPRYLLVPGAVLLVCFAFFGPAEAMLHLYFRHPLAGPLVMVFTGLILLAWGLGLWLLGRPLGLSLPGALPSVGVLILALLLYPSAVSIAIQVGSGGVDPILFEMPNILPALFSTGDQILLRVYHGYIFGLFFPLLYLGLCLPLLMAVSSFERVDMALRLFVAWLGVGALGVTLQDWLYFASHPEYSLVVGNRYGVYFTHWAGFIPTVYALAYLWGAVWVGLAGRHHAGHTGQKGFLVILTILSLAALGLTLSKPLWMGLLWGTP